MSNYRFLTGAQVEPKKLININAFSLDRVLEMDPQFMDTEGGGVFGAGWICGFWNVWTHDCQEVRKKRYYLRKKTESFGSTVDLRMSQLAIPGR